MTQTTKLKNAAACSFAVLLTACGGKTIEGKWVEPVSGMPQTMQGMVLKTGGKAESVNMATLQYEKWEKKGDRLILSGKSIGNHQTLSFSDTLTIKELTSEKLVLQKGDLTVTYRKQQ